MSHITHWVTSNVTHHALCDKSCHTSHTVWRVTSHITHCVSEHVWLVLGTSNNCSINVHLAVINNSCWHWTHLYSSCTTRDNTLYYRRPYWWGGVVNLFWHVTTVLQFDWSMLSSDWLNAVTCPKRFTTPPHQYRRLFLWLFFVIGRKAATCSRRPELIGSREVTWSVIDSLYYNIMGARIFTSRHYISQQFFTPCWPQP